MKIIIFSFYFEFFVIYIRNVVVMEISHVSISPRNLLSFGFVQTS